MWLRGGRSRPLLQEVHPPHNALSSGRSFALANDRRVEQELKENMFNDISISYLDETVAFFVSFATKISNFSEQT